VAAGADLTGAGVQAAIEGAKVVNAKLEEFADDPIYTTGKSARKWGMVALGGGVLSFILAKVGAKVDQSYLNDITGTLGIAPQVPPTHGTPAAPPPNPPPPPVPPQIVYLNQIVYDVNSLGTTSAALNVGYLQDALKQLVALTNLVWGAGPTGTTQTPVDGLNPQLATALVQTCALIYQLEGKDTSDPSFSYKQWATYELDPLDNKFISGLIDLASQPYAAVGPANWSAAITEVSQTDNPTFNYKNTLNLVAGLINATLPFDLTQPASSNPWGVLGVIATDLSAVGTAIASGATVVANDLKAFAGDVSAFAGDVGSAFALIGKVLLNLPRLGFDAMGYAAWWAVDMVANAIWVPLVVVGSILLAYSTFALNIYPRIKTRLLLTVKARTAKLWAVMDARLHTADNIAVVRADEAKSAIIADAIVPPAVVPTVIESPPVPVPEGGGAVETSPGIHLPAPEEPVGPTELSPPPAPPLEATPTEQTEAQLGETGSDAPELVPPAPDASGAVSESLVSPRLSDTGPTTAEIDEAERNRQESLPAPSYRERKAESERERSEAMLSKLNEVFA
jgi:hypothetical protein